MTLFADWFESQSGVLQTFMVCIGCVALEHVLPNIDNQGLQLLYWLTVYSAVTQPVLAYSNAKGIRAMRALERKIDRKLGVLAQHLGVDLDES